MIERLTAQSVRQGDILPRLELQVSARTVILGASSSRDWQPQHHDHFWAVERARTRDIFMNTPNQAGWIERYLTDWAGPSCRLGRLKFKMKQPVCPGDQLVFTGKVTDIRTDDFACAWVAVEVLLMVAGEVATECLATVALPTNPEDNPWRRDASVWRP